MPTSAARPTGLTRRRPAAKGAQSLTAWERVLDRLRMRLKGKPSRSAVFGQAGLWYGKMHHLRLQPDLRMSVIVKLSRVLRVSPGKFLDMMVEETDQPPPGETPS